MAHTDPAVRGRNVIGTAIQLVFLVLLLTILAGVVFVLFQVVSLTRAPTDMTSRASQALTSAEQAVQNVADPNHPPAGLAYDTEITSLDVWHVGDGLPGGREYVLTVA